MMIIKGIIVIIIKVIFMELMVGRSGGSSVWNRQALVRRSSGSSVWNRQTLVMCDGVRPAL